jgi:hypothetical protein
MREAQHQMAEYLAQSFGTTKEESTAQQQRARALQAASPNAGR